MSTIQTALNHDNAIDQKIGLLLRSGVLLSAVVIALGGAIYLFSNGSAVSNYHHFTGMPDKLRLVPQIALGAMSGDGLAVIQLGILLLIATPIARVIFSVFAFALQKDWLYVSISCIVLAILLYSLIRHAA